MLRRHVCLTGIIVSGLSSAAQAQTASQITPPSFTPSPEDRPGAPMALPSNVERQAPEGADALYVTLAGVEVTGGQSVD